MEDLYALFRGNPHLKIYFLLEDWLLHLKFINANGSLALILIGRGERTMGNPSKNVTPKNGTTKLKGKKNN